MENFEEIKKTTNEFREQKDDLFVGIGQELATRGIDINKAIIADIFTEDSAQWYVVIITEDKRVFEFYYDYLHKKSIDGKIIEWKEFTDNPEKTYMHESVDTGLKYFNQLI